MSDSEAIAPTTTAISTTAPSSPEDLFTYSPLEAENEEDFRLLELIPGDPTDDIECRLVNTTRDTSRLEGKKLSYEALSYAWEDTTPTNTITVNDSPFKVTVTLEAALRCLRVGSKEHGRVRRLWIDAICINQRSIPERNHQVRQMREIYAGSHHVNVWLGVAGGHSEVAMDFAKELCTHFDTLGVYSSNSTRIRHYQAQDFKPGLEPFLSPAFENQWAAMTMLFMRPWWGRAWVVQEVASAKTVDVLCGDRSVPWPQLALVFEEFYRLNVIKLATNVVEVRERFASRGHFRGLDLLLAYNRRRLCQDPRDKIFSILGLTDQKMRTAVTPDYSMSVAQVFAMAVMAEITRHWDLWILHEVDRLELSTIYPSWVPDFDEDIYLSRFQQVTEPFTASHGMEYPNLSRYPWERERLAITEYNKDLALFSTDLRTMYVHGFSVSVVDDDNLQRSRSTCRWDSSINNWSWDIDAMVARLLSRGGVRSLKTTLADASAETKKRRVKAALYQVLMLGHIRTGAGIQKMKDVDHEDIMQRAQDPAERGRGGFRGKTQARTVFHSVDGHLGMASELTQVGDKIFVLYGLDTPAVLRPGPDGSYLFISTSYVHGIMQGEAVVEQRRGVYKTERIELR